MTDFAVGRKLCSRMVWVGSLIEIGQMASDTGARGYIVIAIVARNTIAGNGSMGTGQHIIIIVDREGSRSPCILLMTGFAGGGNVDGRMIWICRLVKFINMATRANIGSCGVISFMAGFTIVCNGNMGAGNHIIVTMGGKSSGFPSGLRCMAGFAGGRNIDQGVVRIGCFIKICIMTAIANGGCSGITRCMAFIAVGCEMCPC